MPDTPNKFYLTTPIYYVNARPHIGHAYTTIAADVLARRHRLLGEDVFFLTGTDEHGQKIERSAAAAGIPPQQFADEVAASFAALWQRMGITNDKFIRTTDAEHKRGVQKLFRKLQETGAIYLDSYTGAYCVSDEAFVDLPAGTPCPDCGRPLEIVTEENYFFKLSAWQEELINKIESGELSVEPESRRNEVLSFIRGEAVNLVAQNLPLVENETFREMVNRAVSALAEESDNPVVDRLINEGKLAQLNGKWYVPGTLKDLSISRTSFKWGIPVPDNPQHVIYVWLDALVNYITAVGYGADTDASLTAQQREAAAASFAKYWPADLHLVGKEIIRFHCVYWPAFLLAAGIPLPKKIQAHGWLLFEESKMSKSRGNIVRTETILDAFGEHYRKELARLGHPEPGKRDCDLFAADVLRYFLLREIPFGQDGSFSFDALITRYNADLANGYGNLVSRTLTLIQQNLGGTITVSQEPWLCVSEESSRTESAIKALKIGTQEIIREIKQLVNGSESIRDSVVPSLTSIIASKIGQVDFYLSSHAPWKLAKSSEPSDRQRMEEVLYTSAEAIRILTALLHPIMPHTTAKVWAQLGLDPADLVADGSQRATENGQRASLTWGGLKPGTKLGPLAPIFPRADKGLAQIMADMENPTTPPAPAPSPDAKSSEPTAEALNAVAPGTAASVSADHLPLTTDHSPLISIDDFAKVDLRVAQIVVAERIPKADKLLRLEVDLGPGFDPPRHQILAGIAQYYEPEKLIGRKVVIVANLAPRKMRGLESQGMIVAASVGPDGAPILAGFLEDVELGARLK